MRCQSAPWLAPAYDLYSFRVLPLIERARWLVGKLHWLLLAVATIECSTCSRGQPEATGPASDTGSAPDAGPVGAAGEAVQDIALDRACADFSAAVCGRMRACTPFLLQSAYGDVAVCT